eukprot:tig00000157_g9666.t1
MTLQGVDVFLTELAGAAVAHGRPRLAALLLEREPLAERGAHALLDLQDDHAALQHASAAHDLCRALALRRRPPLRSDLCDGPADVGRSGGDAAAAAAAAELLALLSGADPVAGRGRALFAALAARAGDRELLKTLAFHSGDREEAGLGTLAEFLASPAAAEAAERAAVAQRSADFFAGDPFLARVLAAESARLRAQPPPPRGAPAPPVRTPGGGPGGDAGGGDERGYKQLAAAMGLSPARSARLRARAACRRRDWPALEALAKDGKARPPASAPPRRAGGGAEGAGPGAQVPLEALVEAAAAGGAVQEAARLAARLPDRDAKGSCLRLEGSVKRRGEPRRLDGVSSASCSRRGVLGIAAPAPALRRLQID